ncbi:hypothetical protein CVN76_00345, partial [Bacillus sp. mrc49]
MIGSIVTTAKGHLQGTMENDIYVWRGVRYAKAWKPDAVLSQFIDPIYRYVLPLMLAYSGGKLYGGHSGGIVANVAMIGLIMASDMPMIIGAIIFSPPIGWLSA